MKITRKNRQRILFCFLCVLLPLISVQTDAQEAAGKESVATSKVLQLAWRGPEGKLEVYDNSETYSNVEAINSAGDVLGVREVEDDGGQIRSMKYFYCDAKTCRDLPQLGGYSNVVYQALSDDGKAVGYASRAPGNPGGSLTAIVWDPRTGSVVDLGKLPDDTASHATDISADGTKIVGYSTGAQPARVRPCVWEFDANTKSWAAKPLPTVHVHNPYLIAGGVSISPDGKRIAATATEEILSNGVVDNAIFGWEQQSDNTWNRRLISKEPARIEDVSNAGNIAANVSAESRFMPVAITWAGEFQKIELLDGDVGGEIYVADSQGAYFGMSDDPPGPDGGPSSIRWKDGKTEAPEWSKRAYFSAIFAGNNRGQLAGNIDVIVKAGRLRLAGEERSTDTEDQDGLEAKTLGFRWTPTAK